MCRYLLVLEDEDIKLLLQALQLSTSPCAAHPDAALLPVQMPARLLGTGRSHLLQVCLMLTIMPFLCLGRDAASFSAAYSAPKRAPSVCVVLL